MKIKKQFFSGVVRVFWLSLAGVLILSLGMVNPVRADGVPDLTVASTHSEDFDQGGVGSYTITVSNDPGATGSTDGVTAITVTDTLPAGLTATGMSGEGWTCPVPVGGVIPAPLTCYRTDVSGAVDPTNILSVGNSYPGITLTVAVDADAAVDAPHTLTNEVLIVDGGGEVNTTNNSDTDDTTITQKPNLEMQMVDSGDFVQGGVDKTFTITIKNVGHAPTDGTPIIVDNFSVDADLTVKSIVGTNWTCVGLICTRDAAGDLDILGVGESFDTITLKVDVDVDADTSVTNQADLAGDERGGDMDTSNNSASRAPSVTQKPDLTVEKIHSGNFTQGGVGTYTITVKNSNAYAPTAGDASITVTDTLPAGLTATDMWGNNWTCPDPDPVNGIVPAPLTCTHPAVVLAAGANLSDTITVTVKVAANAAASVTNTVTVSGGGQVNLSNDSDPDLTTIDPATDLTLTNITPEPTSPDPDQDFVVRVTGQNQGRLISNSYVTVDLFVVTPEDLANPGLWPVPCNWVDSDYNSFALDPAYDTPIGPGAPINKAITIAAGALSAGTHTVYAIVDSGCIVDESDETNNVLGPISINIIAPPGAGVYDDVHAKWSYTGSWTAVTGAGPHSNTRHIATTVGSEASFAFTGRQFVFTYTQSTNRGDIEVYVDGSKITTINATGVAQWQKTYVSPILSEGTHAVRFRNAGGGGIYMDLDAIQILAAPVPGAGTYDDVHANWSYTGSWTAVTGAGPRSNTRHVATTVGSEASFAFTGRQFVFTYTRSTNRGNIEVYVDGSKITTINATGVAQWQKTYVSPVLLAGTHVVRFRNAGGGGIYMDLDAIQILAAPVPGAGTYDNVHANWSYTGSWTAATGAGPRSNTRHIATTVGSEASFAFTGRQFVFTYTRSTNRGNIEVYVDGSKITTINATGVAQWQKTYVSPVLLAGTHVVRFRNAGGGGIYMDLDAIQILAAPVPGAGIYDDVYANWSYTGSWTAVTGVGPRSNTRHIATTVGSEASFAFTGRQFVFTYTRSTNRGNIEVYVDGSKITTINATGVAQWQKTYVSPVFLAGTHVVRFRNAGGGGIYMDVDAIQILAAPVPGIGIYDDAHVNWSYTGVWAAKSVSGPRYNTIHYTPTVGNEASFIFTGKQFILFYTRSTNRGNIEVYVDGSKITTINAKGALLWQKTYTSPVFATGTHVVRFRHAGSGTYIDVDAILIR